MAFASFEFAVFVTVVWLAWLVAPRAVRPWLLLAASLVFYAWAAPAHTLVLIGMAAFTYAVRVWMDAVRARDTERSPRFQLAVGVVGLVGVLGIFKYGAMAAGTWDATLGKVSGIPTLPVPEWLPPLGISFVTFGLIHYLADSYKGLIESRRPLAFALYAAFFPTVSLGPIKLYERFESDLDRHDRFDAEDVAVGLRRIITGLFKKLVLADPLAPVAAIMLDPKGEPPLLVLISVYAYAFKLYFDFAGYSDMAIGISRLFGFRIIENFDWPYIRRNISEFWAHWHMSLTRFITTYVFIPLGGSRVVWWRVALNTLVAMGVSGLWHGAAWHYVAWGLYHGVGLVVARWWRDGVRALRRRWAGLDRVAANRVGSAAGYLAGTVLTFNFVVAGWVLFVLPIDAAFDLYRTIAELLGGWIGVM